MFHLLDTIPRNPYIAISGGSDSMVFLDFLLRGRHNVQPIYFNHGSPHGMEAEKFVKNQCKNLNLPLHIARIQTTMIPPGLSPEEHWRNERYKVFNSLPGPVIICQQLNDVAEWWIFSSLHGESKLIPYRNGNIIRPFLMVSKEEIKNWAERKEVRYLEDPSNTDTKYMRNLIRHKLLPEALKVNPGLLTVLRKKIQSEKTIL